MASAHSDEIPPVLAWAVFLAALMAALSRCDVRIASRFARLSDAAGICSARDDARASLLTMRVGTVSLPQAPLLAASRAHRGLRSHGLDGLVAGGAVDVVDVVPVEAVVDVVLVETVVAVVDDVV